MERKAQGEVRIGGEVVSGEGFGGGRRTRKVMASGVEEKVSESESESEGSTGDAGEFEISGALHDDEDDAGSAWEKEDIVACQSHRLGHRRHQARHRQTAPSSFP